MEHHPTSSSSSSSHPLPTPPHLELFGGSGLEEGTWSYEGKKILAPMVRAGTLPLRVLSRKYGADMVYSEEIIDHSILASTRVENKQHQTIDFLPTKQISKKQRRKMAATTQPENRSKFRTYIGEPVVFQMGTNDAIRALRAAQVVAKDVRAIDVNMGCPKHFSVHAGMGAGLLSSPETVKDILSTLVRNLSIPVTCKIRLLDDEKDTLNLLKVIEGCGVAAVGIHARNVHDRPRHPAMLQKLKPLVSSMSIPVIHNGDIFRYEEFDWAKKETGCASVMAARGALWNCSIFRPEGLLPVYQVAKEYINIAERYSNPFKNTKYMVTTMLIAQIPKSPACREAQTAKDMKILSEALERCRVEPSVGDPRHYQLGVKFISREEDLETIDRNRRKHLRSLKEGLARLQEARKRILEETKHEKATLETSEMNQQSDPSINENPNRHGSTPKYCHSLEKKRKVT
mmetsp:Transcript_31080/g.75797  ORF Transcript_31080/g.75797 Transcript_31080/m.75797 type:complete len:458 (+) Transcript_31080:102-1475(+)